MDSDSKMLAIVLCAFFATVAVGVIASAYAEVHAPNCPPVTTTTNRSGS